MKREKRDKKTEEIRVLDKGINVNDKTDSFFICCAAIIIPFRG